jgi:hypothetical protein
MARRPFRALLILAASLHLSACAGESSTEEAGDGGVTPVRGGTLELIGNSDVDHLSTTSSCAGSPGSS